MFLLSEREELSVNTIIKITMIMNVIVSILNTIIGSNYGYLSRLPDNLGLHIISPVLLISISALMIITINSLQNLFRKLSPNK